MKTAHGYILMLTLMMMSLMMFLATYIVFKTSDYAPTVSAAQEKHKAWQLALSGIQCALAQLSTLPPASSSAQPSAEQQATALLTAVVPKLNQWQTYRLTKEREGVNGTLQFCISCEQGKLDINSMYDFTKHTFMGSAQAQADSKKAFIYVFSRIKEHMGGEDLFKPFEKFLKERQYKLNDVTELLTIKEFALFKHHVWYEPSLQKNEKGKQPLYLTDIFTVWSHKPTIQPWLLSDSISGVLGLQRDTISQEQITESLKQFKIQAVWQTDWDKLLKPLYQKELKVIAPSMTSVLDPHFDATIFCVLSHAKVGRIAQKLLAIVERNSKTGKDNKVHITCTIRKLYWL